MRRLAYLLVFFALAGAGVYVYRSHPEWMGQVASLVGGTEARLTAPSPADTGRSGRPQQPAVPVVIAEATRKTVPITFSTIGSVTATASIPLISQVSGTVAAVKVPD